MQDPASLIVDAEYTAEIDHRLAADPWARSRLLLTESVEPWMVVVGAERLPALENARRVGLKT